MKDIKKRMAKAEMFDLERAIRNRKQHVRFTRRRIRRKEAVRKAILKLTGRNPIPIQDEMHLYWRGCVKGR